MSAGTRTNTVPIEAGTLMYWETMARLIQRDVRDISRPANEGESVSSQRILTGLISIADYSETLADEIHRHLPGVES